MPELKQYDGVVTAGGVIDADNKFKATAVQLRRSVYTQARRNSARNPVNNFSIRDKFISARDRLINKFLSLLPNVCKNREERRDFVAEFARRAGCSDLLIQENAAPSDPNFHTLRQMVLNGSPDFSQHPPRKWHKKDPQENLEEFLIKEYGRWIGKGLVRADIKRYDPHLYYAINNWHNRTGGSITHDLGIPAKKEVTEQLVESAGGTNDPTVEAAVRWKERLRSRSRRTQTSDRTV